jgi:hypothetical protein
LPQQQKTKKDVFIMKRSFSIPSQFYSELQRLDTKQKAEIFSALIDYAQQYTANIPENSPENQQVIEKTQPTDPACGVLFRLITAKNVRKAKAKADVQAKTTIKPENVAKDAQKAENPEKIEVQAVTEEKPLRFRAENPGAQNPVQQTPPQKWEPSNSQNAHTRSKKGVSNEYLDSLFCHT